MPWLAHIRQHQMTVLTDASESMLITSATQETGQQGGLGTPLRVRPVVQRVTGQRDQPGSQLLIGDGGRVVGQRDHLGQCPAQS